MLVKPFIKGTLASLIALMSLCISAEEAITSPSSITQTLKDNKHEPSLSLKDHLEKKYNLSVTTDYNAYLLTSDDVFAGTDETTSSGVLRFMGKWQATENGSFNFKLEHRHAYTDEPPKLYGLTNIGMTSLAGSPFNDQGGRVTNMYWRQNFQDNETVVWLGWMDITDYIDAYAQASPWTDFSNLVFSTGSNTMALPDDAAFGFAAGTMLTDNIYVLGGITDASGYSDSNEFTDNVDKFLNDSKHHKSIEIGHSGAGKGQVYLNNMHITFWQQDGGTRHDNNATGDDSEGLNFSASYSFGQWMPFIRGGIAEGPAPLLEKSLSIGTGYYGLFHEKDTLGFAFNWGRANKEAFGVDDEQYISQIYYKAILGEYIQLIPDIQFIKDATLSNESNQTILGLRARFIL